MANKFGFGFGLNMPGLKSGLGPFTLSKALRVLPIGDSLTAGRGAGGGAVAMDGARALSWPTKMRDAMIAAGFLASSESFSEANNTSGTLPLYDPRVTLGSWTVGTGKTIGGLTLQAIAAAGGPLIFAPSTPVDTFESYLPINGGFGTGNQQVDAAGSPVAYNQNGAAGLSKVITNAALGMHDIRLNWLTATNFLTSIFAYNSTLKDFRICNMGARNWSTTDWVVQDAPWRPFPAITTFAPDIPIICLGTNDFRTGGAANSQATFEANMQAIITKAGGKPLLVIPPPCDPAQEGSFTYAQCVASYLSLGVANNCPVYRSDLLFTSWAAMTAAGYTSVVADGLHLSASGYALWGTRIAAAVIAIARANFAG